jgi:pimeloyl-ACP methyl ester carboxylesterase
LIAEKIPGAKLVLIPNASHIFETDQPAAAHQAILEFLSAQQLRAQTHS